MKSLLFIPLMLLNLSSAHAQGPIYHRFWIGYKRSDLNPSIFTYDLNQSFIPATLELGQNRGLVAYEPVLTLSLDHLLPDEVALVSYQDQVTYKKLMSSEAGRTYQSTHWNYFDEKLSGSLVPEAFLGKVELHHAYDLSPEYSDWQRNQTTLQIHKRDLRLSENQYLRQIGQSLSRTGPNRIVRVETYFWLEYMSEKSAFVGREPTLGSYPISLVHAHRSVLSEMHRGVNYQWDIGTQR